MMPFIAVATHASSRKPLLNTTVMFIPLSCVGTYLLSWKASQCTLGTTGQHLFSCPSLKYILQNRRAEWHFAIHFYKASPRVNIVKWRQLFWYTDASFHRKLLQLKPYDPPPSQCFPICSDDLQLLSSYEMSPICGMIFRHPVPRRLMTASLPKGFDFVTPY